MMLVKSIAFMLLASCVHADVDIVVSQQGPDVEWVLSGSVNLDGLGLIVENLCAFDQSMSVFADSENDSVALNGSSEDICTDFYQLAGPQILAEGTLLGCTTTTPPRASTADGFFNMNYGEGSVVQFFVEAGYESGSPLTPVVGRMPETTIDEAFNTPEQFPCTIVLPVGTLGETETITMRLEAPTAAPSTLAPTTLAPTAPAPTPTPAPTVTISDVVYVRIVFPSRSSPLDASDINEVGAAVCHHIASYLSFVYRPLDVALPECIWDVHEQSHNQIRLIFHFTAAISGFDSSKTSARNSDLEIGNVVEESFLDVDVRDDLINDLHNLSDENPLSSTTSVELDTDPSSVEAPTEQPASCSVVPAFLQSIPFLGPVLNTVMCFLFGPEGMLANLTGLFE